MTSEHTSTTQPNLFPSTRGVLGVAGLGTLLIAFQLYKIAQATGNYEGMVFSLVHTVIVAGATVLALRAPKS
jgi:hypothetical protein